MDEGKLWSLIRSVLSQGGAIQLDRASMSSYEEYSARLDAAAAERVADFTKLADARIAGLEAEVSRLRADAERWRYCNANAEWFRNEERTHIAIAVKHGADLSCKALREIAIDAARANGGEG